MASTRCCVLIPPADARRRITTCPPIETVPSSAPAVDDAAELASDAACAMAVWLAKEKSELSRSAARQPCPAHERRRTEGLTIYLRGDTTLRIILLRRSQRRFCSR